MAKKSSLLNMALVLTLVCLGASAAVAVVYAITKEPIELANQQKINSAIMEVVPSFNNTPSEDILNITTEDGAEGKVYVAKTDSDIVGYAIESTTSKGFGGPITIMVGFTPDGEVYNTSVISHTETPGLGAKITENDSHFIQQWKGKKLQDGSFKTAVKKDGGDVDAITASTITSRAYCDAMEIASKIFKNINSSTDVKCKHHSEAACKGHSDAECKGHSDAECKGHSDTECKNHSDAECKGHSDAECKGHSDAECKGHSDAECKGHSDAKSKGDAKKECSKHSKGEKVCGS